MILLLGVACALALVSYGYVLNIIVLCFYGFLTDISRMFAILKKYVYVCLLLCGQISTVRLINHIIVSSIYLV